MKNKKTVLVGIASLLLFGTVAVALTTNKTINFNSMSHGVPEDHYMDIEASQLEQAMNGDGTFALGSYDTWKAENVEFFTEGGLRYAKVGPSASIYSTSTAGSEVANDYRQS